MTFQDVVFLPLPASFYTTFLMHCDRGYGLCTATWLKNVMGISKGRLPVKILCSNKSSPLAVSFHGDYKTATKLR